MGKQWLWAILILSMAVLTSGEMCRDTIDISTNCTMLTPSLVCTSYNYSIFSTNGTRISNGTLANLNSTIYYFNFTEGEGDYIVELCDGSTREIKVGKGDEGKMILFALILLPLILGIFFVIGAANLSEDHPALKIGLFLASIVTFFASLHAGTIALTRYYPSLSEMINWIGTTSYWVTWIFFAIIIYFFLYIIIRVTMGLMEMKRKKDEEEFKF